jgi:hypothetical protein
MAPAFTTAAALITAVVTAAASISRATAEFANPHLDDGHKLLELLVVVQVVL